MWLLSRTGLFMFSDLQLTHTHTRGLFSVFGGKSFAGEGNGGFLG